MRATVLNRLDALEDLARDEAQQDLADWWGQLSDEEFELIKGMDPERRAEWSLEQEQLAQRIEGQSGWQVLRWREWVLEEWAARWRAI